MKLDRLDHIVLTVRNIETTCTFYSNVLGMEVVTFDNGRKALTFGSQRVNLHEAGKELEPKAYRPTPGSADLCFTTTTPIDDVIKRFQLSKVRILEGPVKEPSREQVRPEVQPRLEFLLHEVASRFKTQLIIQLFGPDLVGWHR